MITRLYEPGHWLRKMRELRQGPLEEMLKDPDRWESLDIDYYPPRVERVWTQHGEDRVLLHRIHPCSYNTALWHPHPWPSAITVMDGQYEMGVSYCDLKPSGEAARIILTPGSSYEMSEPKGWHFVRPFDGPVYSLMFVGPKFPVPVKPPEAPQHELVPLPYEVQEEIRIWFLARTEKRG